MDFAQFQAKHTEAHSRGGGVEGGSKFKALVDSMELNLPVLVPTSLQGKAKNMLKTAGNIQQYARKLGKQVLRVTDGDDQWLCWTGPYVPRPKTEKATTK